LFKSYEQKSGRGGGIMSEKALKMGYQSCV